MERRQKRFGMSARLVLNRHRVRAGRRGDRRCHLGVMVFLLLFGALMYLTKRKVWADVAH